MVGVLADSIFNYLAVEAWISPTPLESNLATALKIKNAHTL